MAATSQPIALPAGNADNDISMGSYSADQPFNPASYTRHFLGSPISWRAGSFGARKDDALNVEMCRNYNCCGRHLPDLHALLEHFEDVHVVVNPTDVVVNPTDQAQITVPFNPDDMELELDLENSTQPQSSPSSSNSPQTPNNPVLAQFAHTYHTSPYTSQPPSPGPEEVFNAYARFSADYSSHMPGTQLNASGGEEIRNDPNGVYPQMNPSTCIPPALLFASSDPPANKLKLKVRAPSSSTPATPSTTNTTPSVSAASTVPSTPTHTPTHTPLPPPSLLLSKPFRCPKPNCNKSYKQANGLKYHMTHGSCNFAPPKDLEHVKDLLERKRREREASGLARSASLGARPSTSPAPPSGEFLQLQGLYSDLGLGQITETELRDIEREAEKRLKPFACGVGDCQRRYKNMNGLRYHYQHSGDHGAMGLALLAGGLHECLGSRKEGAVDSGSSTGSLGGAEKKEEREGRRRLQPTPAARVNGLLRTGTGSASVPVSRATSVSRVGTPVPVPVGIQKSVSLSTTTEAFTPGYTNVGVKVEGQASPPMTPLTAAVQGMGLSQQQPTQQQGYQAQFVELQRRQYMQMQAMQQQYQAQYQQGYAQQQQQQQMGAADAMAQQEFVEAQRREFEAQQQAGMGGDVVMG